jgi:hypothetical protein
MIFRPIFLEFFESPKISPKILCAYHIKKQADHGLTGSTILRNNLLPLHHLPARILDFFGGKKNIKCYLPATNHQNTSRINLFCFTNKEMTLMMMVVMVVIRPIWLLWLAKS